MPILVLVAVVALLTDTSVSAQPPRVPPVTPPPTASSPVPPPPPAGRPRAVQVLTLESPAFADGGLIPDRHAQTGRDVSPALRWSGAPEGTVSFALVVRDLDAVPTAASDDTLHWLVWNIAGSSSSLPEGVPEGNAPEPPRGPGAPARPPADRVRQISVTGPAYRGPAAPASGPPHHYVFELYALDTWIDVPAVGQSPAATRTAVTSAMTGHLRGKGVLVGRYHRPAP